MPDPNEKFIDRLPNRADITAGLHLGRAEVPEVSGTFWTKTDKKQPRFDRPGERGERRW